MFDPFRPRPARAAFVVLPAFSGSPGQDQLVAAYNRAMDENRYDDAAAAIRRECVR